MDRVLRFRTVLWRWPDSKVRGPLGTNSRSIIRCRHRRSRASEDWDWYRIKQSPIYLDRNGRVVSGILTNLCSPHRRNSQRTSMKKRSISVILRSSSKVSRNGVNQWIASLNWIIRLVPRLWSLIWS